jgi:MoxR-like ATPase
MPSDVLGTSIFNQKVGDFEFRRGPLFSNIILIDEINRAPAKTQAALFEVMEERQITIDGKTHAMPPPFIVMATQNPVEHEGTYRLPEAQLDRFLFKIQVGYPNLKEEVSILQGAVSGRSSKDLTQVSPVLTGDQLLRIRKQLETMIIEPKQLEYIARIVHQTRDNKALYLGASPRASLAILAGAKAFAAIRGRDFITPDDIREVTLPVLAHRVILTPEKEMEGLTAVDVVRDIVKNIEVPR